jgi:hypothetical protein
VSKRLPHGLLGIIDTSCWLHGQAAAGSNLNILRSGGHCEIEESVSIAITHRRCARQERGEDSQSKLMKRGEWFGPFSPEEVGEPQHLNATLQAGFLSPDFQPHVSII